MRTSDGTLHLVYPASSSGTFGLTSTTISPAGAIGASTSALGSDWGVTPPGLVMLPNGSLEAIFGAISPSMYSPANADGSWGINSSDGGQTWSQPADVRSGPTLEAQSYNAAITARAARAARSS